LGSEGQRAEDEEKARSAVGSANENVTSKQPRRKSSGSDKLLVKIAPGVFCVSDSAFYEDLQ